MLAACYECGKPISTDASRCPNCGYDYYCLIIEGLTVAGGTIIQTESGERRMSREEFVEAHNNAVLQVARENDEM